MNQKILLVEGENDQKFFQSMLKMLNLNVEVKVNIPTDYGTIKNGKIAACDLLAILIPQLSDGRITHLAMILDADFSADGWGYTNTVKYIKNKLITSGYKDPKIVCSGLSFPHADGLNDFGLWIMPDNKLEGMFEDWIVKSIKNQELTLLQHAVSTVKNLPEPKKFKSIHKSKAEIATWLAWQKMPGQNSHVVLDDNLIDLQSVPFMQLTNWLRKIYS